MLTSDHGAHHARSNKVDKLRERKENIAKNPIQHFSIFFLKKKPLTMNIAVTMAMAPTWSPKGWRASLQGVNSSALVS